MDDSILTDDSTVDYCNCNCIKYYDIICIGAGAAGLYLGYQMIQNKSDKSLLILEKLNKVGGRAQSIPFIDKNVKYVAEGCAQRFMNNQQRVKDILDFFNIGYVEMKNNLIATTDSIDELIEEIIKKYNPDDPCISEISNLDALVNTPTIKTGSYDNLRKFANANGYLTNTRYMSLFYFYESVITTSMPKQNFVYGGFHNLFKHMAKYIQKKYPILLNTCVINVEYDICTDSYIINNEYQCKKLVFTGILHDLNLINTNSVQLRSLKSIIYDNLGHYKQYIKIFFHFNKGWWTEEQIPMLFKNLGPLSIMFYMTLNDIMIYNSEENANLIHSLIPLDLWSLGYNNIEWISINKAPRLKIFAQRYIKELIQKGINQSPHLDLKLPTQEELDSITYFSFKFTREAILTFGQMFCEQWKTFIPSINNYNNIHVIGGDYNYLVGWIEGAFESVDINYENIVNF